VYSLVFCSVCHVFFIVCFILLRITFEFSGIQLLLHAHAQCNTDLLVSGLLLNLDVDLISFHSGDIINGVCVGYRCLAVGHRATLPNRSVRYFIPIGCNVQLFHHNSLGFLPEDQQLRIVAI
jgi:hypothetical protein